jgi:hypothetical protein
MIVRLICCTGGSVSPWAIFKHDRSGEWHMDLLAVRDIVFRLRVVGRRVRTTLPAPYEGSWALRALTEGLLEQRNGSGAQDAAADGRSRARL